jgi:predicted homoserine dehydrogenase-like protein
MYAKIAKELELRPRPVQVAVVGAGWFGCRVVRELLRIRGLHPRAFVSRTPEKAVAAYREFGIAAGDIAVVHDARELRRVQETDKFLVFSNLDLIRELQHFDLIYEATGNVPGGVKTILNAYEAGLDVVTVNSEMEATVGLHLARLGQARGVGYSNSDGDQPGVLARLIDELTFKGLEPRIVGNCKKFLNLHQTPEDVKAFIPPGIHPYKACLYADGTKQSAELAVLGNAYGYCPVRRGMHGPATSKQDLLTHFSSLIDIAALSRPCIEFTMGTSQAGEGSGVFVVAEARDAQARGDLKWVQQGDGPWYLFCRDYHLAAMEAASTVAEMALYRHPTLVPRGRFVDVIAMAKRDLLPGHRLDGLGGYDCYGLVEKADVAADGRLLPVGLAQFAVARTRIAKDTPITRDMVELDDNLVVRLRQEQDRLPVMRFMDAGSEPRPQPADQASRSDRTK